ncbi:MAG: YicC family protein [Synergistaceae bacterium]|jgi:uncharacterized protein (TIGR00255 family)|nr:YicC family protein [Synergistaceae bacterium]
MYVSMTGFGAASEERQWGTATVELSSVNHRYQDISVRLPRELSSFEPWFHQRLRGMFRRGKIVARVEITWSAASAALVLNKEAMTAYYREISPMRGVMGAERDISLDALVNLPGVLDISSRAVFGDDNVEDIMSGVLYRATENWNDMRRKEGAHLKEAVGQHLNEVERLMKEIGETWTEARDSAFETVTERLKNILASAGISVDEARFTQEAIIFADKWDISEEIARMSSHAAKFREIGEAEQAEGRKLDFLAQEMNREANTINSKVTSADLRWLMVNVKSAVERIREQIQNLE